MNLWSHRFSQNTNEKLSGFLPCEVRAEILTIFCSYFGRNDDFTNSFWNELTFNFFKTFLIHIFFVKEYLHKESQFTNQHLKYRLQYKPYESCMSKNAYSCNNLKTENYVPFTYACLKRTSENEHWIDSYLAEQIAGKFTQPFTNLNFHELFDWLERV